MSGEQFFSFPTVEDLVKRFEDDEDFATAIDTAFETNMTPTTLRAALEAAYDNVTEDVLRQVSVALGESVSMSGVAVPTLGPKALMVAVFCKGNDLVVRYKIGSGGFLDLIRTPNSAACNAIG